MPLLRQAPDLNFRDDLLYSDLMIVPGHGPTDLSGQAYQHTLDLIAAMKPAGRAKR